MTKEHREKLTMKNGTTISFVGDKETFKGCSQTMANIFDLDRDELRSRIEGRPQIADDLRDRIPNEGG